MWWPWCCPQSSDALRPGVLALLLGWWRWAPGGPPPGPQVPPAHPQLPVLGRKGLHSPLAHLSWEEKPVLFLK